MAASREKLIRHLWPDKLLFGATLLMWTGVLGVLYGLALQIVTLGSSSAIPAFVRDIPPVLTIALSGVQAALGYVAMSRLNTNYGIVGGVAGLAALSLVGLGPLFSLVALVFIGLARLEKEDLNAATLKLSEDEWPDKSLAASLMCFMGGIITLGWGFLVLLRFVNFSILDPTLYALAAMAIGAFSLYAARELYHQRAPLLGFAAGLLGILALGLYIIGPILGIGALFYLNLAQREREFSGGRAPAPKQAAPPAATTPPQAKPPAPATQPRATATVRPVPRNEPGERR